ncbi:MAG: nickel pincer cofactor biosynthesis protein LarB [Actinobacteria bacterium]|nr:nickel pincer cofactor biosynthesis protein LarB [Actinomycetota bacterium]MCB9411512.1 nickel pincer cofactor biosynthesis protein LarB [Actinomycetota bacterium]
MDSTQDRLDLGWATLDTDRAARTGDPEVVFGEGKTADQVVAALTALAANHPDRAILATRLAADARQLIGSALPAAVVDPVGRTALLGSPPKPSGTVALVSAGSSDAPVVAEAAATLTAFGAGSEIINDVGVAGVHRVLAVRDRLLAADAIVVVAGMDGALPSVVGGLTGTPIVAVPTSVGYGASFGGIAALLTMLNSCAPGVAVVNIDNGFGAAVHAARIARRPTGGAEDRTRVP